MFEFPTGPWLQMSRDSAVGIGLATGWITKGSEFESWWGQNFSLFHVQTGSVAHPASYPVDTGGKAVGAWSWPLTYK
jgi:hypothetical protein